MVTSEADIEERFYAIGRHHCWSYGLVRWRYHIVVHYAGQFAASEEIAALARHHDNVYYECE